jgi:ribosomal protein S27AE
LAALFERPVVIKPPEVVAAHDFLLIGWILLLLMGAPWLLVAIDALAVGVLGYLAYAPAAIITTLTTPSTFINDLTAYFALAFNSSMALLLGAVGLAVFLILIIFIYLTTVRRTSTGNYEGARAASLFWGAILILLALVSFAAFLGIVYAASAALLILPALFFLMGYGKMGEVIARYGPMAVLSGASPIETAPQIPSGAAGPPMSMPPMPMMAAPAMGMGTVAMPAGPIEGAVPVSSPGAFPGAMPMPPPPPSQYHQYQPLGGAVPRVPLCPTCGRELYYASNYKRWYCMVCESRR